MGDVPLPQTSENIVFCKKHNVEHKMCREGKKRSEMAQNATRGFEMNFESRNRRRDFLEGFQ